MAQMGYKTQRRAGLLWYSSISTAMLKLYLIEKFCYMFKQNGNLVRKKTNPQCQILRHREICSALMQRLCYTM